MVYGFAPAVCIMMGFFTAVGGGMLRDRFYGCGAGHFQRTNFYAIAPSPDRQAMFACHERHHQQCRRAGRMRCRDHGPALAVAAL
ncbi:MAG: TRIC cation channel family protein [Collinsella sp.]